MGRKKMYASSARAQQELGFRVAPVYPAMRAAIEWFRAHGYARENMTNAAKARPVFIAALQREIASLTKSQGWRENKGAYGRHIHVYLHDDALIACAGMGVHRASLAVEAALSVGPASELISVGWAGACDDRLHVGDVIHPSIVIDAKTGERFFIAEPTTTETPEILVTVATPAGAIEKHRLGISYYASAVDMEAAAVARIARARELPFMQSKLSPTTPISSCPICRDFYIQRTV
jgi:uridine phosphorylase